MALGVGDGKPAAGVLDPEARTVPPIWRVVATVRNGYRQNIPGHPSIQLDPETAGPILAPVFDGVFDKPLQKQAWHPDTERFIGNVNGAVQPVLEAQLLNPEVIGDVADLGLDCGGLFAFALQPARR